eukprot:506543_1
MKAKRNVTQTKALLSATDSIDKNDFNSLPTDVILKLRTAIAAIIFTTFCDGLAYYGIIGSINLFLLTELNQSKAAASVNTSVWAGTRNFIAIISAVVADSCLGRFKTILIALFIYAIGSIGIASISIALTNETADHVKSCEQILFWLFLYLFAVGSGSLSVNNRTFGAEQFKYHIVDSRCKYQTMRNNDNQLCEYKESYFQWIYFFSNIATLFSYTLIAYLCQDVSFAYGYSIPAISVICGILIFSFPSKSYHKFEPKGSVLIQFIKILVFIIFNAKTKLLAYNPKQISKVKDVLSLFPFWICYIIYSTVYSQLDTLVYAQGCQMDYHIGSLNWNFPITSLSLFYIIPVLLLIPVLDTFLFPLLRNKYNCKITTLRKMGAGFIFAILAMIWAGIIEIIRRDYSTINTHYTSICDTDSIDNQIYISNLSIFWQIPIFVFHGISQVLTVISGFEFFFDEAPRSMKSVISAFFTMSIGLGQWITGIYIILANIDKNNLWITNDLNGGHLDWYFFIVALLVSFAFVFFIWYANKYQYRKVSNDKYDSQPESELTKT